MHHLGCVNVFFCQRVGFCVCVCVCVCVVGVFHCVWGGLSVRQLFEFSIHSLPAPHSHLLTSPLQPPTPSHPLSPPLSPPLPPHHTLHPKHHRPFQLQWVEPFLQDTKQTLSAHPVEDSGTSWSEPLHPSGQPSHAPMFDYNMTQQCTLSVLRYCTVLYLITFY